jgi:hypothetical protein
MEREHSRELCLSDLPAHLAGLTLYRLLLPRQLVIQSNVQDEPQSHPPCDMPRSERRRIRGNCLDGIALPSLAQAPVAGGAPAAGRGAPASGAQTTSFPLSPPINPAGLYEPAPGNPARAGCPAPRRRAAGPGPDRLQLGLVARPPTSPPMPQLDDRIRLRQNWPEC